MGNVKVDDMALKDPRYVVLGRALGTTKFDALGRMVELWAYCTEKQTYFMTETSIDICADREGFYNLIMSPEIDLGERQDDGSIRIKGTEGRIEWLGRLRNNSVKGGLAKAAYRQKKILPVGKKKSCPITTTLTLTPTIAITNKNKDTAHASAEFDLEEIYKKYPRKMGKQKGIAACSREIKNPDQFNLLMSAVERYAKHCRKENLEPRFIKHFSSFMSSWRDWLDPDVGSIAVPKQVLRPEHVVHVATPESQERPLADHRLRSQELRLAIARAGTTNTEEG